MLVSGVLILSVLISPRYFHANYPALYRASFSHHKVAGEFGCNVVFFRPLATNFGGGPKRDPAERGISTGILRGAVRQDRGAEMRAARPGAVYTNA